QYIDQLLQQPEFQHAINRDRIRHILVVEANGKISDSSEPELRGQVIEVPEVSPDAPVGRVMRGDPVAALTPDDHDADAADDLPDTYWTYLETTSRVDGSRKVTWI